MNNQDDFKWFDEINYLNKKLDALIELTKLLSQKVNEIDQKNERYRNEPISK